MSTWDFIGIALGCTPDSVVLTMKTKKKVKTRATIGTRAVLVPKKRRPPTHSHRLSHKWWGQQAFFTLPTLKGGLREEPQPGYNKVVLCRHATVDIVAWIEAIEFLYLIESEKKRKIPVEEDRIAGSDSWSNWRGLVLLRDWYSRNSRWEQSRLLL